MEQKHTQALTTNKGNTLPAIPDAKTIAAIRLNEREFPHYKNIPKGKRIEWVATEIKMLADITRAKNFDAKDSIIIAAALDEVVMEDFYASDLTFPEIRDSFKKGVFGIYGEFKGLSAPNLYGFLNSYLLSENKKASAEMVRKEKEKFLAEKKRKEREEEQRKIWAEIEEAKKNGTFVPTGRAWYKPQIVDEVLEDDTF